MTWLTWRQFRAQAFTATAALAVFAVLLAATGPHLASLYATSGISGCQATSCEHLASNFLQQLYAAGTYWVLYLLGVVIILLAPALIGLFWGAPLIARELETGTSALAWNQSITRTRWLAVKLTLTGLGAMALTEGLSLMQAWWAAPIGRAVGHGAGGSNLAMGRFSSLVFATHGITPLGYAAFAFTLGVTAGALIRRTVPAMAVTLAIFAAVQIAMPLWIRPHLFPARHSVIPVSSLESISLQQGGLNGASFSARRREPPRPTRRLAPVQRSRQRRRAPSQHHPGRLHHSIGWKRHPCLPRLPGQPRHPGGRQLSARQPLLGLPVDRGRDLPRPGPGPGRVLFPAARPPPVLTGGGPEPPPESCDADGPFAVTGHLCRGERGIDGGATRGHRRGPRGPSRGIGGRGLR